MLKPVVIKNLKTILKEQKRGPCRERRTTWCMYYNDNALGINVFIRNDILND